MFLFSLTRHSAHHEKPRKNFWKLSAYKNAPQMPYGYPAMILIACVPFLWFKIMHQHMENKEKITSF